MKSYALIVLMLCCVTLCSASGIDRSPAPVPVRDSLVQLASRYYSDGEFKRAIALTDPAESLWTSPPLSYYKGMSYAALYEYPRAMEHFRKAIHGDSANVHYRYQYGRLLIQAGFLERAANELSTCTRLDSTYLPAWYQLGLLFNMQKNNLPMERDIFSFLVRRNPDDFMSLYYLGDVFRRSDLADSGITCFRRSVAVNPQYYPSLIALAHAYSAKKEYAPALELFNKALEIRPHDKDLLFQTGECLRKSGALNEAVACFKNAIAIDSTADAVHAQLGYAYYSLGRFDSSVEAYKRAIALDDDNVNYYKNLTLVYQKMDSVDAAIQMSKHAIRSLHPENILFANTSLAALYASNNRQQDAVAMYKRNIAAAYMELATFYHSHDMRTDAIQTYQRVLDLDPSKTDVLFRMAGLYEEMNENKAAIQIYAKLMQSLGKAGEKIFKSKIEALKKK